jgi:hypothetical protein
MSPAPWDHEPVDDRRTDLLMRALVYGCRHNPSGSPHTVADHPADAMHLPPPVGTDAMSPAATAMPPRPRELPAAARRHGRDRQMYGPTASAGANSPPTSPRRPLGTLTNNAVAANRRRKVRVSTPRECGSGSLFRAGATECHRNRDRDASWTTPPRTRFSASTCCIHRKQVEPMPIPEKPQVRRPIVQAPGASNERHDQQSTPALRAEQVATTSSPTRARSRSLRTQARTSPRVQLRHVRHAAARVREASWGKASSHTARTVRPTRVRGTGHIWRSRS